jgi:alcohol dehydrogenase class IV
MDTAARGLEYLARLTQQCALPQRLSELGVPREVIPSMAKVAMQVTRLLKNNPRPMTEAAAIQIYEAIY